MAVSSHFSRMWFLDKAKQTTSGYVNKVQEKASTFVAHVQDEAQSVLEAMAYSQTHPLDPVRKVCTIV